MTWLKAGLFWVALAGPALADTQIYVWNRAWTPGVQAAVSAFASDTQGWRVLAAESDGRGQLKRVAVDWPLLEATRRPITAVIRVDGQLPLTDSRQIVALVRRLPPSVAAVEIDHDSGVLRLPSYARFLKALRPAIGLRRLAITALPAWLDVPALDDVLAATDEVVLQVHAVRKPGAGLFDPRLARLWADTLSRRDNKPFRIALPDYTTAAIRDEAGSMIAVESEMPRLAGGASREELITRPADVAGFVRGVNAHPPAGLAGLVWFRLPATGDVRIWSPATLRAVMRGQTPANKITAALQPGAMAGGFNVTLQNDGDEDTPLPSALLLPADCRFADGVSGYGLKTMAGGYSLNRLQNGILRAHHRRIVGWARCRDLSSQIRIHP